MKKGISLIVLIVTIIVIIILAAAVILTLNRNNPIDSSRVSQLADNRANLNSAVQLYFGKKMAETQGVFETPAIFKGGIAKLNGSDVAVKKIVGTSLGTGERYYTLTSGTATTAQNIAGNEPGAETTESALGVKIPTMTNGTWYLDTNSGLVYLTYASKNDMPTWMFEDGAARTKFDSNLNEFVKIATSTGAGSLNDVVPAT